MSDWVEKYGPKVDELLNVNFLYKNDEDIGFQLSLGKGTEVEDDEINIVEFCDVVFEALETELNKVKNKPVAQLEVYLNSVEGFIKTCAREQREDGLPLSHCADAAIGILILIAHGKLTNDEYNGVQSLWLSGESGMYIESQNHIHGYDFNKAVN